MIAVLPMAGRGSRFSNEGYTTPKPLIQVQGKPMYAHALQSLQTLKIEQLVVVALKEHDDAFGLKADIKKYWSGKFELVLIDEVTEGQLQTVLKAHAHLGDGDLLIIPSDSFVVGDLDSDIKKALELGAAGVISVYPMPGDRWSFAKTNELGDVVEVAEKVRISDFASTGIYYFSDAIEFERIAKEMIETNKRTKGEFYVIPLYNELIANGQKVKISLAKDFVDLGNPSALQSYVDRL